jgi:hypothetical protein
MTTEAEQLRAYVLLHGWQARDIRMDGSCYFMPSKGVHRAGFVFFWTPCMSAHDLDSALLKVSQFERDNGNPRRTYLGVYGDLPVACELMMKQNRNEQGRE